MKTKVVRSLALLASGLLLANSASAAVTTIAYYPLGESDPGAVGGASANAMTVDAAGGAVNLHRYGSPTYASETGVTGSTLCLAVAGGGYTNNAHFAFSDNWGVEAWVNADTAIPALSANGYASIVYNGNSGGSGMGLYQTPSGQFIGLCGSVALVGGAPVQPGTWTHLALVTEAGTTTLYVNGASTGTAVPPLAPTGFFSIGLNPTGSGGGEHFQGKVDEVRVFSFAPGQFTTDDLLLTSVPPTLSSPPLIVSDLAAKPAATLIVGDTFTLNCLANGSPPLYYFWRHDGSTLASGTNTSLSFTNVTASASGDYSVVVSNSLGTITSSVVNVTILPVGSPSLRGIAYYRFGENDPGSVGGAPANSTTVDFINGLDLTAAGNPPTYSIDTGVNGSTRCITVAGGGYSIDAPFALTNNWSIEAWVKADVVFPTLSTDGYSVIAFNGNSSLGGMGILQSPAGQFVGLCSGVAFVGGAVVVPGVWTHLALVDTGGTTTFYVNGVATGSIGSAIAGTSFFGVGFNPGGSGGGEHFEGSIDEVRVCSVVPNRFAVSDLLLTSVPPGAIPASVISGASVDFAHPLTGASFTLSVVAGGTSPLKYEWRRDGLPISGATNSTLRFTNVTTAASGPYDVVVTNLYGSVTSAVATVTVLPPAQPSAIYPLAYYRLGENDSGAVAGETVAGPTLDIINGLNLQIAGTAPTYTANTSVSGSTLGIAVAGGGFSRAAPFVLTTNWGIEAWVKADVAVPTLSANGYSTIVFDGDSSINGMGILQTPIGRFVGVIASIAFVGGADVVPGVWTHLALVNTGGTVTFYVNGVASGTAGNAMTPTSFFGIGFNPAGRGDGEPFEGSIDEVRIFAFDAGLFSTNNLLLASAPSTAGSTIALSGSTALVTWDGERLQHAAAVSGPWTTMSNAPSPWVTPASGTARFFRATK